MENPFKFGTIVEEEYFTDRVEEVAYIKEFVKREGKNNTLFGEFLFLKEQEFMLFFQLLLFVLLLEFSSKIFLNFWNIGPFG